MSDGTWEGGPEEPRRGLPTWVKWLIGCGCGCGVLILALGLSCFGLARYVSRNPEAFERRITGMVRDFAREDWTFFRESAEKLRSEDGARALYAGHAGLRARYATEAEFLAAAAQWRPLLTEIPREVPDFKRGEVIYNRTMGTRRIGFRDGKGTLIQMEFEGRDITGFTIRKAPEGTEERKDKEAP
jgi:hypothetical protein